MNAELLSTNPTGAAKPRALACFVRQSGC